MSACRQTLLWAKKTHIWYFFPSSSLFFLGPLPIFSFLLFLSRHSKYWVMCFPEINVFWRPVLGRVDTQQWHCRPVPPWKNQASQAAAEEAFWSHTQQLKGKHSHSTNPIMLLRCKAQPSVHEFDTMFYFNLYFHCFYTLHIRQQFTKYLSFYFLLLQVWSLRTLRPPGPCRVPSWGSSSSSLGLAPSWAPVCWQSFPWRQLAGCHHTKTLVRVTAARTLLQIYE